jgi:putative alpha-1,2-mannosidase
MTLVLRTARPEKAHFPFRVGRKTILISFAGRGALPDWLKYSYVTPNFSRAVSRGVEYAANDFALHQVSLGLNLTSDAAYYLNRSRNWRNYWNPSTASLNHTGFVQPRAANASFISYSPVSSPPSHSVSDDVFSLSQRCFVCNHEFFVILWTFQNTSIVPLRAIFRKSEKDKTVSIR